MLSDPVSDYLTRLRNALAAEHDEVEIPASGLKREMSRILKEQGYILNFEVEAPTADHPGEIIRVQLKYTEDRRPAISGLRRVSRPGQRHYAPAGGIRKPDSLPFPHLPAGHPSMPKIEHIVVLMMENHSFDNLLGMVPHELPGRALVDGFTRRRGRLRRRRDHHPARIQVPAERAASGLRPALYPRRPAQRGPVMTPGYPSARSCSGRSRRPCWNSAVNIASLSACRAAAVMRLTSALSRGGMLASA